MVNPNIIIYSFPYLTLVIVFSLAYIDLKKKREKITYPLISFIVPCYNDAQSVEKTIESIYSSYTKREVFVINDKSKDNSLEILKNLRKKYKFKLVDNKINLGKSRSINSIIDKTKGEIIFVVDADVILSKSAVENILRRFAFNKKIAAVSCPYKVNNSGFLPTMQDVEYTMSKMVKYAQNSTSVLALWGGCLAVKRKAFLEVNKFSENALVEDVDLALKLYEKGYKVEQSSIQIKTSVPDTLKSWISQKVRWTSGGTQTFLTYKKSYFKNPLTLFFNFSNLLLIGTFVFYLSIYIIYLIQTASHFITLSNPIHTTNNFLTYIWLVDKKIIIRGIFIKFGFMTFTLPYIFMLINSVKDLPKILYILPFTIIYSPAYTLIYFYGWGRGIKKYFELKGGKRAW